MKLLWQAIRAAAVDTFGVVLVVWLLLGLPLFSYHSLQSSWASGGALQVLGWPWSHELPRTTAWPHPLEQSDAISVTGRAAHVSHSVMPHAAVWVVSPRGWMP